MGRKVGFLIVVVVLGVCGASWGQKASNPNPADGATDVMMGLLRWTPGPTAIFHDVYYGTTPELGPEHLVEANNASGVYFDPMGVVPGTTYYWRIDAIDRVDGTVYTGDVWSFLAQPLTAFHPEPADGSNEVSPAATLTWLKGMGATKHHVYFSDSFADVNDRAVAADKGLVTDPNFAPGELEELTAYYWCVDEVGATVQAGEVWSFITYAVVDNFEGYNDDVEAHMTIFDAWIDGLTNNTGSTVGYWEAPFCEQRIVHGGLQSMPFEYSNVDSPWYSEGELDLGASQDWTANGADMLTLYVQGRVGDFVVPRVSAPPVLDGEIDEAWLQASVQVIETLIDGAEPTGPADLSGRFRVLYDSDNLYVLVDVNDEALVQDSDPAEGWQDDRIEVFIDGDNSKDDAQDGVNDYQYCFRWNHGEVETPVEWYLPPASLAGVEYAVVTTDSGYLFEIKLPWSTMIGRSAEAGELIGIDVMIGDDDDGGDRDSQVSWHLPSGNPHTPSLWGTGLLAEPPVAGAADFLYVALGDSSNRIGVVTHPDPEIIKASKWTAWEIPFSAFTDAGVNLGAVRSVFVGVGDPAEAKPGGSGMIFIDDIRLTRSAAAEQ